MMRSLIDAPRRAVLGAALLAAAVSGQSPVLEPPIPLPGDLVPGEAGGVQMTPYVAPGAGGSLAVWVDHRAEFNSPLAGEGGPDVLAIRLDAAGQPLDSVAIRLPPEVGDKSYAKAAWNGSAWLVTWENQQPLGTSSFMRLILGARIAADGTVLDAQPIVIKDDEDSVLATTAVASDGTDWVVVAQGTPSSPSAVVAVRVLADGTVANPGGAVVHDPSVSINRPDLEHADGRYLLVYAAGTVRGVRFSDALAPIGGTLFVGTGSSAKGRVATDGQDFLVTWENADFGRNIRARRVLGASGAMSSVLQVTTLSNFEYNWEPDASWNGAFWHVAFKDSEADVYRLARIAPDLTLLDPGGAELPFGKAPAEGRAIVSPVTGGVTVVFERQDLTQNWPGGIHAALVDDAMNAAPDVVLSLSASRQGRPAIAAGESQYLVAFPTEEDDTIVIEVQRLDAFGAPLDAEPIELASANRLGHPGVAWNGEHYLVVWEDRNVVSFQTDDEVYGMRVGADGSVLDAVPLLLMDGGTPDVAAQGDVFLVVSSDPPSGDPSLRYPYARRIGSDGAPLGPAVQLGGLFARYPRAAPLGTGWIVTWQRNFTEDNPNSVAHAALVAADGSSPGDFVVDGEAGFGGAARPSVASSGDEALLVWQDDFQGLAGRRILADGTLLGAFAIAPLPALPSLPDVAWNGDEYLVTWQDYRAQIGLWDYRTDVYAARVSEDGVVLDGGGGFAIAASGETELFPAVAGAVGASVLAWVEMMPDPPHATLRVNVRRESPWSTLGGAVGGAAGAPLLQAEGQLVAGTPMAFVVDGAPALAGGSYVIGATAIGVPFKGGVLVPAPDLLLPVATDALGAIETAFTVPGGLPSGAALFVQCWLSDASAPSKFAGSNAIMSVVP